VAIAKPIRRVETLEEVIARALVAALRVDPGAALDHLRGRRQVAVPTDELTALTFADAVDAEAAHAILTGWRIFALRTVEAAGSRLWIRWAEPPEPALVRAYFERAVGGLAFRVACEGETLAPLHGGGRLVNPDGRPGSLRAWPRNSLAPLARRAKP